MHKSTIQKRGHVVNLARWFRVWYPPTFVHMEKPKCKHVRNNRNLQKTIVEKESSAQVHHVALEHLLSN